MVERSGVNGHSEGMLFGDTKNSVLSLHEILN